MVRNQLLASNDPDMRRLPARACDEDMASSSNVRNWRHTTE